MKNLNINIYLSIMTILLGVSFLIDNDFTIIEK